MTKDELRELYHSLLEQDGALRSRIQDLKKELELLEDLAESLDSNIERVYDELTNKED